MNPDSPQSDGTRHALDEDDFAIVASPDGSEPDPLIGARISITGIHFAPDLTGNAPYTALMAESLASAGARVTVFTGVPHYPEWRVPPAYSRGLRWRERLGDVEVRRYRHWVPKHPDALGRAIMDATFLASATIDLLRAPADAMIAVTPALAPVVAAVAARRGRPLGTVVQDLAGNAAEQSGTTGSTLARAIAQAEYRLLRACDLVGVITPQFGAVLEDHGVRADRIIDVPNCMHIAAPRATRAAARRQFGWDDRSFHAVYTGSLGRKQGLDVLIDAAQVLALDHAASAIKIVIVGSGPERAQLEHRAEMLSNVQFLDPVDEGHYPELLSAADALVLTERAGVKEMSLPSKLTSYSSAGRPIVASVESDGITGALLHELRAALMAPAGDGPALAEAIMSLARSSEAVVEWGEASARLQTEGTSRRHAVGRYRDFARSLLTLNNPQG